MTDIYSQFSLSKAKSLVPTAPGMVAGLNAGDPSREAIINPGTAPLAIDLSPSNVPHAGNTERAARSGSF